MKKIIIFITILLSVNCLFGRDYQVGDHKLLAMPTAYTMPAGDTYFTDYELVFLNFTFAPTNRTHAGFLHYFPLLPIFWKHFQLVQNKTI